MLGSTTTVPLSGPVPTLSSPAGPAGAPGTGGDTPVEAPPAPSPSPRLSLDHATGLVVIEFRASAGRPGQSFPTPKELEAYRRTLDAPGDDAGSPVAGADAASSTGL